MPLGIHRGKPGKQKQTQAPGFSSAEISQKMLKSHGRDRQTFQSDILQQVRKEEDDFHVDVIKNRCWKGVKYGEQLLTECARVYT